jgi:hypothetical protein
MNMIIEKTHSHKAMLLLTAMVVIISVFVAAMPFFLTQKAHALDPVVVWSKNDLKAALADPTVGYIELGSNIVTDEKLVLSRSNVVISGDDKSIVFTGDPSGWQSNYVFQIYNATNVEINSLRVFGGDAGILVNSSQVLLKGDTHVDGFEFGGIEVSRSSNSDMTNSSLTLQGALWNETNSEAFKKPAVWLVDGQGTIDSSELFQTLIPVTYAKPGQTQYYLRSANTGVAAPVITNSPVYVNSAKANDVATWSHAGTNVDHFEYREYASLEAANSDDAYFVQNVPASERQQVVGSSWTSDITLYYRIVAVDAFGNRSALSELGTLIIDKNAPSVTLDAVTGTTNAPTLSGTANPDAVTAFVSITKDGVTMEYQVGVSNGGWSYTTEPLVAGNYTLSIVSQDAAGNRSAPAAGALTVVFTEPAPNPGSGTGTTPGNNAGTSTPTTEETVVATTPDPITTVATVVPSIVSPRNLAAVLGDTTQNETGGSTINNDAAVEGVSSSRDTVAAAVNSEANRGSFVGMGWYWWLLIIGAVMLVAWMVVAAVRRGQA